MGLIDKSGQLVEVMTLGTPRFNHKYDYEILRLCNLSGYRVIGGASKLLRYFIDKYGARHIVSYCSLDKFSGEVYKKIGMKETGMSEPGYIWTNSRSTSVVSRYQVQKRELVKNGFGDETETEDEIMRGLHYLKVYNAGNKVFELELEDN